MNVPNFKKKVRFINAVEFYFIWQRRNKAVHVVIPTGLVYRLGETHEDQREGRNK